MLINLLPSEIARLVLNYLEEECLGKTYELFLEECKYLTECKISLERGVPLSKTIHGKTLKEFLVTETNTLMTPASTSSTASSPARVSPSIEPDKHDIKQKQSVSTQTPLSYFSVSHGTPVTLNTLLSQNTNGLKTSAFSTVQSSSHKSHQPEYLNSYTPPKPASDSILPYGLPPSYLSSYENSPTKRQRITYDTENEQYMRRISSNGLLMPNGKHEAYDMNMESHNEMGFQNYVNEPQYVFGRQYYENQSPNDHNSSSMYSPPCKCGSTEHRRITHKACPLNTVAKNPNGGSISPNSNNSKEQTA